MAMLIHEAHIEEELIAKRRASGADRYDEVWEGVYVMSPLPNNEHQTLVAGLTAVFHVLLEWGKLGAAHPGVNVSDREGNWTENYRCPDVAVFLKNTTAKDCGTHWCGGPDFAVEILSPDDPAREKLEFYGRIRTRELLLIDRQQWGLELYTLAGTNLTLAAQSAVGGEQLVSGVLPVSFRLVSGARRPQIEVVHNDGQQRWLL